MTAPAAIQATFADFKLVRGRKVAQIVAEVPIEHANAALRALGGIPQPHAEQWIALARLNPSPAADQAGEDGVSRSSPAASPKKAWADTRPSAQAGIRCGERAFQEWLAASDADEAARAVRFRCGITTRAELDTDHRARVAWHTMDTQYLVDTGRMAAPR